MIGATMELNENARIDTSQVEDRRGPGRRGRGTPIQTGGGGGLAGMIIAVLVALVGGGFGLNAMDGDDGEAGDNTALEQKCAADGALQQFDCRNTLYVNSIQAYWQRALPESFGERYTPSKTVSFSQAVSAGCGQADCYAGAWAKNATGTADARPVNPDEFTHGTSEQRKEWFTRGYRTDDPKSCDTFGNGS